MIYKNWLYFTLLGLIVMLSFSCSRRILDKNYNQQKTERIYNVGVGDAAKPQPWEISSNLTAINKNNNKLVRKEINGETYILVSSWKEDTIFYKNDQKSGTYNTQERPIWITLAPELQEKCATKKFGRKEGLNLRLRQLLGLPPNDAKKYFVEFWVKPQDLFRPCPDNEIEDKSCGIGFPKEVSKEYESWINNLRIASYYNKKWDKNYPWTELGYTYDWNPKSKNNVGLSEFVIGKNKDIIVHRFYTTLEYCSDIKK